MSTKPYPLVTIGIPTYNRAAGYLPETLNSALQQTYPNLEIIVSDNGSTDGTEAYLKSIDDSRIRYFKQVPPLKPNDNFNFCLSQAQGAYFLLLHDDDILDPDFVESCLAAADYETTFGVLRSGTRIIDGAGELISEQPNLNQGETLIDFLQSWFSNQTMPYFCTTLYNTALLQEIGGFQSKHDLFQDAIAIVQLIAQAGAVDVSAIKASFRIHNATRTQRSSVKGWCEDSLQLFELISQLVPKEQQADLALGKRFLSVLNYRRAAQLASPRQRWSAYFIVYRTFDYHYSPWRYFVLTPRTWQLKRNLRGLRNKLYHRLDYTA